ncbi:MAG TPA: hypothetical protein VK507_23120, partial [Iamia sp.]|nr:hypothetical protein [Iamia sp.]
MPTTAEVEARLRRTAEACEPLVDELVRSEPPAGERVVASSRRGGWLVAAAVLVVLAVGAGVVAVAHDGAPDGTV